MPLEVIANKIPMDPDYISIDDFLANETSIEKGKISPVHLTENWRSLVEVTSPVYKIVPLTHYCDNAPEYKEELFHWSILESQVKAELEWLKSLKN